MIHRLRAWHRIWFVLLALLLPVLLVLALRDRPKVPRVEALPEATVESVGIEPPAVEPAAEPALVGGAIAEEIAEERARP